MRLFLQGVWACLDDYGTDVQYQLLEAPVGEEIVQLLPRHLRRHGERLVDELLTSGLLADAVAATDRCLELVDPRWCIGGAAWCALLDEHADGIGEEPWDAWVARMMPGPLEWHLLRTGCAETAAPTAAASSQTADSVQRAAGLEARMEAKLQHCLAVRARAEVLLQSDPESSFYRGLVKRHTQAINQLLYLLHGSTLETGFPSQRAERPGGDAATVEGALEQGAVVMIVGLTGSRAAELNGQLGELCEQTADGTRWRLRRRGDVLPSITIRPVNIQCLPEACRRTFRAHEREAAMRAAGLYAQDSESEDGLSDNFDFGAGSDSGSANVDWEEPVEDGPLWWSDGASDDASDELVGSIARDEVIRSRG